MKYFPYKCFRQGQEEAIEELLHAIAVGHNKIELSAPTASGKTVVLYTVGCNLVDMGYRVLYTTPQIALLDQIKAEHGLPILKGLKHYYCPHTGNTVADCPYTEQICHLKFSPEHTDCQKCNQHCLEEINLPSRFQCPEVNPYVDVEVEDKIIDNDCPCKYLVARQTFDSSPFAATTLAFAFADPRILRKREIVLVDESSGLEDKLIELTKTMIPRSVEAFNQLNLSQYLQNLKEDYGMGESVLTETRDFLSKKKKSNAAIKTALAREYFKVNRLYDLLFVDHEPYLEFQEGGVRKVKLLYGRAILDRVFKDHQLVFASGTPTTDLIADHVRHVTMPHPIPKSQRKIYFVSLCANLSKRSLSNLGPERCYRTIASVINQLEAAYGGKHTLVHCIGYNHAKQLASRLQGTVFLQDVQDREAAYEAWLNYPDRSIFLSVGREQGINLKGEEYNLNIIIKLPWGNLGEEWLQNRMQHDSIGKYPSYLEVMCATNLMQACGRTTRTPTDFSRTFVLERLPGNLIKYLQPWFRNAMQEVDLYEVLGDRGEAPQSKSWGTA